jgi:hypothetical protein
LPKEAETLFGLARAASGSRRGNGLDFRCYETLARLLGWEWAGRVACFSDRLRPARSPAPGSV